MIDLIFNRVMAYLIISLVPQLRETSLVLLSLPNSSPDGSNGSKDGDDDNINWLYKY